MAVADEAADRLAEARHLFCQKWPYFRPLLLKIRFIPDERIQTCGISPKLLFVYNPEYVAKRSLDEALFLVWHEINHVLSTFTYGELLKGMNHEALNFASDLEINSRGELERLRLPPNIHLPQNYGLPTHRTTGEYLDMLREKPGTICQHSVGSGSCWVPKDLEEEHSPEGASDLEVEAAKIEVARAVEDAKYGTVSNKWKEWATAALRKSPPDWRRLLRNHLLNHLTSRKGKGSPTYARPHRRAFLQDGPFIFPGSREITPSIAVAVDTSGSMSAEHLSKAIGLVISVAESQNVRDVLLIQADSDIKSWEKVPIDRLRRPFEIIGRGGTSFVPVIERLNAEKSASILLYFTDGCGEYPDSSRIPVVWGLIGCSVSTPPWGKSFRVQ